MSQPQSQQQLTTMEEELQKKLNDLFEANILGNYNPKARLEAMEAKFEEHVKLYRNKDKIQAYKDEESKISDPIAKSLFQINVQLEFLAEDIVEFNNGGGHKNFKFRQLLEKCSKISLELDQLPPGCSAAVIGLPHRLSKVQLLQKTEGLEQELIKKLNHEPNDCPDCN